MASAILLTNLAFRIRRGGFDPLVMAQRQDLFC